MVVHRPEDDESKASLHYVERPTSKQNTGKSKQKIPSKLLNRLQSDEAYKFNNI